MYVCVKTNICTDRQGPSGAVLAALSLDLFNPSFIQIIYMGLCEKFVSGNIWKSKSDQDGDKSIR